MKPLIDFQFVIQARMGSSRLPGKILMKINESQCILDVLLDRIQSHFPNDAITVATTDSKVDDVLAEYLADRSIEVFRGSEHNVFHRFLQLSHTVGEKYMCRLTADNPLIPPELIKKGVNRVLDTNCDFLSTRLIHPSGQIERFAPKGYSLDIFSKELLQSIDQESLNEFEKEHVIPSMYYNCGSFEKLEYKPFPEEIAISIDTINDFEYFKRIILK